MKIQIKRKDGNFIIGKRKKLSFTISQDLQEVTNSSAKDFYTNDISNDEWSVIYQTDAMLESGEMIELSFKVEDYERTIEPISMIYWKNDAIDDEVGLIAEVI